MIARVRGLIFASSRSTSRLQVSVSTSTSIGFVPTAAITSADVMKVNGDVITSSPRLTNGPTMNWLWSSTFWIRALIVQSLNRFRLDMLSPNRASHG